MDLIKEAFARAKTDISELKAQISSLAKEIEELKLILKSSANSQLKNSLNPLNQQTDRQTNQHIQVPQQTFPHINQTGIPTQVLNEPLKQPLYVPITQNNPISTGNGGVPTDRQTDRQTDQQTDRHPNLNTKNQFERVSQLISSLDQLKREVRLKFKHLTSQEMLVFSTIYQLEEEGLVVDYAILASKLSLTESSIRDYVLKITRKGIPLIKTKENNKKIHISVSSDLKNIASLSTIVELREL